MKQDSKPLWQRLNEERTQGEWKSEEHDHTISRWYGNITAYLGNGERGIMNIETISCQIKRHGIEKARVNAEYTALAVNNLASLAEALQNLIDDVEACKRSGIKPSSAILNIAKEALNKIS